MYWDARCAKSWIKNDNTYTLIRHDKIAMSEESVYDVYKLCGWSAISHLLDLINEDLEKDGKDPLSFEEQKELLLLTKIVTVRNATDKKEHYG